MEFLIVLLLLSNIFTWIFLAHRYERNKRLSKITYTLWVGVDQLIKSIEKSVDEQDKVLLTKIKEELDTLKFYSKSVDKTLTTTRKCGTVKDRGKL